MSKRKSVPLEQRIAIVRRHLIEGVAVSDLAEEFGIHPTQYYRKRTPQPELTSAVP